MDVEKGTIGVVRLENAVELHTDRFVIVLDEMTAYDLGKYLVQVVGLERNG